MSVPNHCHPFSSMKDARTVSAGRFAHNDSYGDAEVTASSASNLIRDTPPPRVPM